MKEPKLKMLLPLPMLQMTNHHHRNNTILFTYGVRFPLPPTPSSAPSSADAFGLLYSGISPFSRGSGRSCCGSANVGPKLYISSKLPLPDSISFIILSRHSMKTKRKEIWYKNKESKKDDDEKLEKRSFFERFQ